MANLEELRRDINAILNAMAPVVQDAARASWRPSDGFLPLVTRATLVRQHDTLRVIVLLVEQDHGYAAAPLLRSACEELIWTKYLGQLQTPDAEQVLLCLIALS